MIRFQNVDNEKSVLTIDKKDQDELNENVMTVFDVASTLATCKEQFDQLYAMLETVPDFSVVIPKDRFEKLNVGFGLLNGTIVPIVIYRTSSGALSFIMYMHGRISKIYPEAGDIFTTSFQEAVEEQDELTRRRLGSLKQLKLNLEKMEQEQDAHQNDDECPMSCSYNCRCMDCGADCSAATQQNHEKFLESLKAAEYPVWMDYSDKDVYDALKETLLNVFGDSLYSDDDESEPAAEEISNLDKFVGSFDNLLDNAKATEETVNELTKHYEQIHELEQRLATLLANKVKLQCMADEHFKNLCK